MLAQDLSILLVKVMESGAIQNWNVNVCISLKWDSVFSFQGELKDGFIKIEIHVFLLGLWESGSDFFEERPDNWLPAQIWP